MKELLTKIEEMKKINEELKNTKETALKKGKQIVIQKLNALYKTLSCYSDLAKLIPDHEVNYNISLTPRTYLRYNQNGCDWTIKLDNTYLPLNIKDLSDWNYRVFTINDEIIQAINDEEIKNKVEEKTMIMFEENINKTNKKINEYNKAFETLKSKISPQTITSMLESLFDAKNQFENTGDLDLIEIILDCISTLESLLKGDE